MKRPTILLTILVMIVCFTQVRAVTPRDTTLFRDRRTEYRKYVILPEDFKNTGAKLTIAELAQKITHDPADGNLQIDIYNVLFGGYLVAFSVMPSLYSKVPVWKKINLDTIRNRSANLDSLRRHITEAIKRPQSAGVRNLKFLDYALVAKRADGYYCSATDVITEFFEIIDKPDQLDSWSFQINPSAKLLSVAEYESDYRRRRRGDFSQNFPSMEGYNFEAAKGEKLYRSMELLKNGEKQHNFWFFGGWGHHGNNYHRGSERFIYVAGKGLVSASYDWYMPHMLAYWQAKLAGENPSTNVKYVLSHAYYDTDLLKYLTEYTIPFRRFRDE